MNIIDLGIIAILALGFGLGWYKGFLVTALSLASNVVSWIAAFAGYKALASFILEKTNLDNTLLYLTAGVEKLSDMTVANVDVATLPQERIVDIIQSSELPTPIASMMTNNILNRVFAAQGITTLSDYFNQTIINLSMGLISFLIIFLVVKIVSIFVIGLVDHVIELPVLKQFDKIIGGAAGVLQAVFIVAIIFAIVPIAMSVLPIENFNELIQGSLLGRLFFNNNIIFGVLKSVL